MKIWFTNTGKEQQIFSSSQGQADLKHVQSTADLNRSCEIENVETNFHSRISGRENPAMSARDWLKEKKQSAASGVCTTWC